MLDLPDRFNFYTTGNPAFKMVDLEQSNAIRPSTTKDIALQLSEFWQGNQLVIPANFGLMVSPAIILKNQLDKPSDWAKAWQPLSLALAASRPDSLTNFDDFQGNFSLGLSYTLFDKADERHFEKHLREQIVKELDSLKPKLEQTFVDSLMKKDSSLTAAKIRARKKRQMDHWVSKQIRSKVQSTYSQKIAPEKKKWKENNWAAERLNFSAAASWHASDETSLVFQPDSLGPNSTTADTLLSFPGFTQLRQYAGYLSYNLPFPHRNPAVSGKKGKSKKQWGMLALTATYGGTFLNDTTRSVDSVNTLTADTVYNIATSTTFHQNAGLSARFYVGAHKAKAYVEGQLFWDSRDADQLFYLADIGLEISLLDGIWMTMYAGITNTGSERFINPSLENHTGTTAPFNPNRPHFIANFDLRFSLPETFYD
ncbi:MAG: hypothetical protein AAF570_05090 [Bacteroidota bacterium]